MDRGVEENGTTEGELLGGAGSLYVHLHIRGGPAALKAAAAHAGRIIALDADDVFAGHRELGGGRDLVLLDRRPGIRERDVAGTAVLGQRRRHARTTRRGLRGRGSRRR